MNYKRYFLPNSMVFITIVTYNRKQFLLDYIDLIKTSITYAKTKISFNIEAIVILKDHIHFIIQPENIDDYPNIIKYFKTYFSRNINIDNSDLTEGKKHKKEKGVWQSRYWAHIILAYRSCFNPTKTLLIILNLILIFCIYHQSYTNLYHINCY